MPSPGTHPFLEMRNDEEKITQVTQEIESRVIKKLSRNFSRTEFRILSALSKLEEIVLNPQVRTQFGAVPGTIQNADVENQGPNEDRSQNDPRPEVRHSVYPTSQSANAEPNEVLCIFLSLFHMFKVPWAI